jgi:hypothetical protein
MAKRLSIRSLGKRSKDSVPGTGSAATKIPSVRQSSLILLASVLLLLVALFVWYRSYYTRPSVVLWDAIGRAMNTPGVVKRVVRQSEDGSTDVMSIARFEGEQGIQIRTSLSQKAPDENGTIIDVAAIAESLGSNDGDFQRYIEVPSTGIPEQQKLIFEQIVGKWVKTGEGGTGKPGQLFVDNLLGTIPFGNLLPSQRDTMISFARNGEETMNPIFSAIDYGSVKRESKNGRPVYTYTVAVQADSYTKWYQQYFAFMGYPQFADRQYSGAVQNALGIADDTRFIIEIDVLSRQIRSIARADTEGQELAGSPKETIYSYGIAPEFRAPGDSLTTEQFQQIITEATGTGSDQEQPAQDGAGDQSQ